MFFRKKTQRQTIKEVSIYIISLNEETGELFTEEKKIGFNDCIAIEPKYKILRIQISSFESIRE
jgi:hypothetical protein